LHSWENGGKRPAAAWLGKTGGERPLASGIARQQWGEGEKIDLKADMPAKRKGIVEVLAVEPGTAIMRSMSAGE
jgi:hypothetical protein